MTAWVWSIAGRPRPAGWTSRPAGHPMPTWRRTSWPRWTTRSGPARVIAPAGSGKTRVLTERLRLLVRRGTYPGAVTALAYNTRAAEEMRDRASDALGPGGPHVRTLNSLALWICNTFGPTGRSGWSTRWGCAT